MNSNNNNMNLEDIPELKDFLDTSKPVQIKDSKIINKDNIRT